MGASLKAETTLSTDNVPPKLSAASNVTENSSVKSSIIPDQNRNMELGKMTSPLLPGPGNASPGYLSISKTSLYFTGEISYAAQPKQVSVSGRPLNPPEAGRSKVASTPSITPVTSTMGTSLRAETRLSTDHVSPKLSAASNVTGNSSVKSSFIPYQKLVTSPMGASPKAETSTISTDNASPKTSASSNMTENSSTKSSSIPDQKLIIEFGKMTSSSMIGPSKVFQTPSPTLQTSPTREDLYTARPKPVSSTVTVQRNAPSSPSNPPSSSSGFFRTDASSNKLYASVEPMTKSTLPSRNQYTIVSSENKAFNLPPKSTNSTTSQPLSATTFPLPAPRKGKQRGLVTIKK